MFTCTLPVTAEMCVLLQASELAEFTAKITLLEEAKRKKEDEANEWQHKVLQPSCVCVLQLNNTSLC